MPPQQPNYDFITNPQRPQRSVVAGSALQRAAVAGGGLVLLLIIGVIAMNLLKGSDKTKPAAIGLLQRQQILLHVSDEASTATGITQANEAIINTIGLSIGSEQQQLLAYLTQNHIKVGQKDIATVSTVKVDADLQAAVTSGTYNTVLRTTLDTMLSDYGQHLKTAQTIITGKRGAALIQQDIDGVNLLLTQVRAAN